MRRKWLDDNLSMSGMLSIFHFFSRLWVLWYSHCQIHWAIVQSFVLFCGWCYNLVYLLKNGLFQRGFWRKAGVFFLPDLQRFLYAESLILLVKIMACTFKDASTFWNTEPSLLWVANTSECVGFCFTSSLAPIWISHRPSRKWQRVQNRKDVSYYQDWPCSLRPFINSKIGWK